MTPSNSPSPRRWTRRLGRALLGGAALVALLSSVACLAWRHPLPEGQTGPAADALAHSLEQAVRGDDWNRTGAVRWTFLGGHHHLWDRQRGYARVRWSNMEVLLEVRKKSGLAFSKGRFLDGKDADKAVAKAYAMFVNDMFWLNPVVKLFDPGVHRALVTLSDADTRPGWRKEALLAYYSSGGVTPGDKYLWIADTDGRPVAWRLWVSVLPIPGLEFSWDSWQTLATGALVSTHHGGPLGAGVTLHDVAGAATLEQLEPGPDPFAALARR